MHTRRHGTLSARRCLMCCSPSRPDAGRQDLQVRRRGSALAEGDRAGRAALDGRGRSGRCTTSSRGPPVPRSTTAVCPRSRARISRVSVTISGSRSRSRPAATRFARHGPEGSRASVRAGGMEETVLTDPLHKRPKKRHDSPRCATRSRRCGAGAVRGFEAGSGCVSGPVAVAPQPGVPVEEH